MYLGLAQLFLAIALAGTAVVHGALGIVQIGLCMTGVRREQPGGGVETGLETGVNSEVEAGVGAGVEAEAEAGVGTIAETGVGAGVGATIEEGVGAGGSQLDLFDEHARHIDDQSRHVQQLATSVSQQLGSIKLQMQQLFTRRAELQQAQQVLGQ